MMHLRSNKWLLSLFSNLLFTGLQSSTSEEEFDGEEELDECREDELPWVFATWVSITSSRLKYLSQILHLNCLLWWTVRCLWSRLLYWNDLLQWGQWNKLVDESRLIITSLISLTEKFDELTLRHVVAVIAVVVVVASSTSNSMLSGKQNGSTELSKLLKSLSTSLNQTPLLLLQLMLLLLLLVCCCSESTSNWWWGKITSSSVCNVTPCSKTSEKIKKNIDYYKTSKCFLLLVLFKRQLRRKSIGIQHVSFSINKCIKNTNTIFHF